MEEDNNTSQENMNKLLKMEFLNLLDKNPMKEFEGFQSTSGYSSLNNSLPQNSQHSFKIKTKPKVNYKLYHKNIIYANNNKKLVFASMTNNIELVNDLLLSKKVNPNIYDEFLRSPLHLSAARGYSTIVKLLLKYGARPNEQDSLGNYPLHLAAGICNISVIKFLLEGGANVNSIDSNNRTALDLVISKYKSHYNFATNRFIDLFGVYTLLKKTNCTTNDDLEMKSLFENLSIKEIV